MDEKKYTSRITSLEKGKIPPQAVDLEEVVLGALMIDSKGVDEMMVFMKPEYFYNEKHQKIFQALLTIYNENKPIDLLTASFQLRKDKNLDIIGGEFYLIQLTQKVSSSAHIEHHSKIIVQKYIQREIIKTSNENIELAYDDSTDVFDLTDGAIDKLSSLLNFDATTDEETPLNLVEKVIQKGKDIYSGKIKPGIETPIKNLTKKSGGWRDSELIILAARPGMGKTSFALLAGYLPSVNGIAVAFFSLEMDKERLVSRLISMEAEIDGNKLTAWGLNDFDIEKIKDVENNIKNAKFYIDDTDSLTIKKLRIKLKRMKREHGVKMAIIDYLQLMVGTEKNREQEISKISRGLKILSKELKMPIIALSQLSRAVESRGGSKRPLLSDLRESGAIEQDADIVMFIYRPEYYNIKEWDDYNGVSCVGEAEYIVAKNRNGGLVRNRMKFEDKYTKFSDLEENKNEIDFNEDVNKNLEDEDEDLPF